jgi:hypothetical protein
MRRRPLVTLLAATTLLMVPASSSLATDSLRLLAQVNHLQSQDDEPTTCPPNTALYQGKCVSTKPPPKKSGGQTLVLGTATTFGAPTGPVFQSF